MDEIAVTPRRRTTSAVALVGVGVVAGLVLAGLNVASAQSGPAPTPSASAAPDRPRHHTMRGGHGMKHLGGKGIHGEFVVKDPDGEGYRTMAFQRGEATAVSATSITVRSEDGFSRTYAVGDDTLVNAGDEGVADISTGDRVHVMAVLEGEIANAIRVVDATKVGKWRQKWHPRRGPKPSDAPAT